MVRRSLASAEIWLGNDGGVLMIYLYSRLMLSPRGLAGSSPKGRYPASIT